MNVLSRSIVWKVVKILLPTKAIFTSKATQAVVDESKHAPAASKPAAAGEGTVKEAGRLFVRLDSEEAVQSREAVHQALRRFPGKVPVFLFFADTKKYLPLARNFWVTADERLLADLGSRWGKENIILK